MKGKKKVDICEERQIERREEDQNEIDVRCWEMMVAKTPILKAAHTKCKHVNFDLE